MGTKSRLTVMAIQLAGVLLSAFLVLVTYLDPGQVEDRYQQLAFTKAGHATEANWSEIKQTGPTSQTGAIGKLMAFAGSLADKAEKIEEKHERFVQGVLANALSERCGNDCNPWVKSTRMTDSVMVKAVSGLRLGETSLQDFIVGRYDRAVSGMTSDLRRFGLVNFMVLSLALVLIATRRSLSTRIALFSVAVTGYTAWAAYDYLFQQDWARTVLLQDWAATGYQFWMIFVACLFFDWIFLRGWITDSIVSSISNVFSV